VSEQTLILGIESSCDETACAVVADGRKVLSSVVASQIDLHARFGGVVPELASRAHIEAINAIIARAMDQASVTGDQISAVAVTNEPGLIGSLLIGLTAAKTLAWAWDRPLVAVNHVYAHAYAAALDADRIDYPAVALICSGGHTALYACDSPTQLHLLGSTVDDAAGEAFDKVAGILHLGYPGGPAVEKAAERGDARAVPLPRSLLAGESLDFSFSGIKTAVLYHVNGVPGSADTRKPPAARGRRRKGAAALRAATQPNAGRGVENFSEREIADLAASFQAAVVDVLRIKMRRALKRMSPAARTLILGGGVAANSSLRHAAEALAPSAGVALRLPDMAYCLDNAAMIAGLGYHYFRAGRTAALDLPAHATVR